MPLLATCNIYATGWLYHMQRENTSTNRKKPFCKIHLKDTYRYYERLNYVGQGD